MYQILIHTFFDLLRQRENMEHQRLLFKWRTDMVQRKYMDAVRHYGKVDHIAQKRLKKKLVKSLRRRVKPRIRYKLRTRTTQYCGYVFTEWL